MRIVGFVKPNDWDDDDTVTELSISTDDDDYIVESNTLGEELFDLLDEDVDVTGIVTEDKERKKRIHITSYEVLENYEYGDDEDYEYEEDDEGSDFEKKYVH